MTQKFKNYINGKWVDATVGETYENRNPANGNLLGIFPKSSRHDVLKAIDAAYKAYLHWRLVPAPKRGEILYRVGQLLVERKEKIASEMTMEMGKVVKETRGDVQEGIDMSFFAAGEGRRLLGDTTPSELPNKFAMSVRMPIGVIGVITPWNFPMAIPTWKIMPALVAGNTIVWKPARWTPWSAYNLTKALEEAGLPVGVLNLVFGFGGAVGDPMVEDKRIGMISFTGSTDVGTNLQARCPKTYKRVSCEMGGKNAIMVMDDADLDLAVEGIIWSAFGTTGQRCTACSRLIAHKKIIKPLTEKVVARAKALRLGDGLDPKTEMGPVVNADARAKIHEYVQIGKRECAKLLCGGYMPDKPPLNKGYFYAPTVFGGVTPKMRIAQEEIFGPVLGIIACGSLEEAVTINNETDFGLSSAIYTKDVNRAFYAMRDIDTGLCYINSGTIGAEVHLPFGGTRGTGNGHREAGQEALTTFTEWKSIFVDFSGKLQKAQIDEVKVAKK
jgi:acyl-CoA reductase-like NAD-dependent aldehyde dehydrogenase